MKLINYTFEAIHDVYCDNNDGVTLSDDKKLLIKNKLRQLVLANVIISSISHVELDKWAEEYSEAMDGKSYGFHRLDFFNGALTLKQKLEGTSDER